MNIRNHPLSSFCAQVILLAMVTLGLSSPVWAHGPTAQDTETSVLVKAPPEKIWSLVKNFSAIADWHPEVASVKADGGNEEGVAMRTLTLKNGGSITERLDSYDDAKMRYKSRIREQSTVKTMTIEGSEFKLPVLPVSNYSATLMVEPADGGSKLSWNAKKYYRAYPNNNPPPEASDEAANEAVKAFLEAGIQNIKKLAEQ